MYHSQKTQLRHLSKTEFQLLRHLTHTAKSVYNEMLYSMTNYYDVYNEFLTYTDTCFMVKNLGNYKKLPSQVGQQVLKVLDKNWASYFRLLSERKRGNYNRPISEPKYLPKDGYFVCIFQKQSFSLKENTVRLSLGKWCKKHFGMDFFTIPIPENVFGKPIKECRLLPRQHGRFFELEFVYEVPEQHPIIDPQKIMAIDIGLDNFATCTTSDRASFILEGRGLKAYNQLWNKRKSNLQSHYDLQGIKFGKGMAVLNHQRDNKMRNAMSQYVNYLIKHCLDRHIGQIVIGELKEIKQHGHLGKKNNQHFQSMPYGLFRAKLKSKCELYGIQYVLVNEAYTSQTCYHCGNVDKKSRVHRGLYICRKCGVMINADQNGSINIGKKVAPNFTEGSSGHLNCPERVRLLI